MRLSEAWLKGRWVAVYAMALRGVSGASEGPRRTPTKAVRTSSRNVQADPQLSSHADRRDNHPQRPGVTPLRTDELANIAGSYRVAEDHTAGHCDDLYRHVLGLVHHEFDDGGDRFGDRWYRFHGLSLAERI